MISHDALKHLAVLNNCISRRKWTAAFRAADQLDMVAQREAGQVLETAPCSVTYLPDRRPGRKK